MGGTCLDLVLNKGHPAFVSFLENSLPVPGGDGSVSLGGGPAADLPVL